MLVGFFFHTFNIIKVLELSRALCAGWEESRGERKSATHGAGEFSEPFWSGRFSFSQKEIFVSVHEDVGAMPLRHGATCSFNMT